MSDLTNKRVIEQGLAAANFTMYKEDRIWSRYSSDKVDIGEELARVIRTLNKAVPLQKKMRALSIGSSAEPQFRILETAFRGGLYLLDKEKHALDIVKERIRRQHTDHVRTIRADYKRFFLEAGNTRTFFESRLDARKTELITLHHSLYYCEKSLWETIIRNLYREVLAPKGAIHIVLMASKSRDEYTTTWLYNHFVGKYFGLHNDQDLRRFKKDIYRSHSFAGAQILLKTNRVRFFVDDFEKFMATVWMVLLYPNVHNYSLKQKEEITEFVYKKFWKSKRPLIQMQDHLAIYRGIPFKGL